MRDETDLEAIAHTGSSAPFRRDRVTVLAYLGLASYAFYLYAMGPIAAYLRTELHLSYTLASLHSTMWAVGGIVTGVFFSRLTRRLGRRRLLWVSAGSMALAGGLLAVAPVVAATLAATFVLGTVGTAVQTATSAILVDRHGRRRDRALVEANVGASAAAVLAPATLGALQSVSGWQVGLALPAVVIAALFGVFRHDRLPAAPARGPHPARGTGRAGRRLPAAYWPGGILVSLAVGIEFCVIYFAPQLLHASDGLSADAAATALAAFYAGELVGRAAGGPLTSRPGRTAPLTLAALGLTAAALPMVWLSGRPGPAVGGLVLLGLGIGNLYPLSLSLAVDAAGGQTDAALGTAQLLVGAAVAAAPLGLGALADHIGIGPAFTLEPALVAASALLLLGWRSAWPGRSPAPSG